MSKENPQKRKASRRERLVANLVRLFKKQASLASVEKRSTLSPQHRRGATMMGVRAIRATLPSSQVSTPAMIPMTWWSEQDVVKGDVDRLLDEVGTGDAQVGDVVTVSEEKLPLRLLNGRKINVIRRVHFNRKTKRRFKEYLAEDEAAEIFDYNKVMRDLIPLYGVEELPEDLETVTIVESTGPADVLRKRGHPAVGTLTGAFVAPSVSALQLLMRAKTIFLWPDNDKVGARHMNLVANRLHKMGHEDIRVVLWKEGPRKGDAADFDGDDDALAKLFEGARQWKTDAVIPTENLLNVRSPHKVASRLTLDSDLRPPAPEIPMTRNRN